MSFLDTMKVLGKTSVTWTKNHKAELYLAGSLLSLAGAVGFAIKGGINTPYILEDHRERVKDAKIKLATNKDADKYIVVKEYARTAGYFGFEFGPSAAFTAGCVLCTCGMYGTLKDELMAAWAAYTSVCTKFSNYRQRVIEDKGVEADKLYLTGTKPTTVTVEDSEGKKEKVKVYPELPDGSVASPYAFKFGKYKENGELNLQWKNDRNYDMMYLLGQSDYLSDQLYCRSTFDKDGNVILRGSVFLNETRDLCGEDPIVIGQYVGNLFSNGEPGCNGFINLNIIESTEIDPETGMSIPCFWIDPNVDGMISDKLEKFEAVPFKPCYYDNDGNEIEYSVSR